MRIYFAPKEILTNNRIIIEDEEITIKFTSMRRIIDHIEEHENINFRRITENRERQEKHERALFMLNKITKEVFKKGLQMTEKRIEKEKKMNDIWNVLRYELIEYMRKIEDIEIGFFKNEKEEIKRILLESEKVRKYFNNSFMKIGNMYTVVYPGIIKDWTLRSNMRKYLEERIRPNRT